MPAENTLEIDGNLARNPIPELLVEIAQNNLSGSLRISKDEQKIVVYFDEGDVVFAVSNTRKHRLFEILLSQEQISKENLAKIENFTNDFYLAKELAEKKLYSKQEVNIFFSFQLKTILNDALEWKNGAWQFSSLARIKEGLRFDLDLKPTLYAYAKSMDAVQILERFKTFDEEFSLNPKKGELSENSTPHEAFILSRMTEEFLSIDDIRSMCGLEGNDVMPFLYSLWLGGFLIRKKWDSALSTDDLEKISAAKMTLKKSAISVEEEKLRIEKEKEKEAERLAKEKAEKEKEEQKSKDENEKAAELGVQNYIKRIKNAATYYEMFDVSAKAEVSEIKKSYFALAKNFHPDLFHKKVEPEVLQDIQDAFTEIAQAYETLKEEEAREVYDFKLRKVIQKLEEEKDGSSDTLTKEDLDSTNNETRAAESFEKGYSLLTKGDIHNALPLLGRAVNLEDDDAQYHAFYGKALSNEKETHHKAETELRKAVELEPENEEYRLMLAELFIDIGLKVRAKGELSRLLKIAPNNQEAKSLLDSLSN